MLAGGAGLDRAAIEAMLAADVNSSRTPTTKMSALESVKLANATSDQASATAQMRVEDTDALAGATKPIAATMMSGAVGRKPANSSLEPSWVTRGPLRWSGLVPRAGA